MCVFSLGPSSTYLHLSTLSFSCQSGGRKCLRRSIVHKHTYSPQKRKKGVMRRTNFRSPTFCSKRVCRLPNMCIECLVSKMHNGIICSELCRHVASCVCVRHFPVRVGLDDALPGVLIFLYFSYWKDHSLLCGSTQYLFIP
jgi:hypothetical protein